jgi:hypothetical protein
MSTVTIKVVQSPYYIGTVTLDGYVYQLKFAWNLETVKWYLNIEGQNNDVDIKGIALLPGKDLLAQYGYHQLGQLWVIDNSGANEDPNYDDFGSRWTLEYTTIS